MSGILTFDSYEDESYKQMAEQHSEKNLETIAELYGRWDKFKDDGYAHKQQPQLLGTDLELTALINLSHTSSHLGGKYHYYQESCYLISTAVEFNEYKSIKKLAKGVQELVRCLDENGYGAKINPVFYTVTKEIRTFSDEKKQELKEFLNTPEMTTDLNTLPFLTRIVYKYQINRFAKAMLNCKDIERGLTETEREEFERLYFKEETKK